MLPSDEHNGIEKISIVLAELWLSNF